MEFGLLMEGMSAAASVGMGCGTCCGSATGVVLSGYLMSHGKDRKQSVKAFLVFYLGKVMGVMALCALASMIGRAFIDENGMIGSVPVSMLVNGMMFVIGLWFLIQWIREKRCGTACGAHGCSCVPVRTGEGSGTGRMEWVSPKVSFTALYLMGVGYGVTPCAPLLFMMGYAVTLPAVHALVVGGVFALCSAVSPMLLLLLLSGALAVRMYQEIPAYLSWFRFALYILMICFFGAKFLTDAAALL